MHSKTERLSVASTTAPPSFVCFPYHAISFAAWPLRSRLLTFLYFPTINCHYRCCFLLHPSSLVLKIKLLRRNRSSLGASNLGYMVGTEGRCWVNMPVSQVEHQISFQGFIQALFHRDRKDTNYES
jgi:hypothetical protein